MAVEAKTDPAARAQALFEIETPLRLRGPSPVAMPDVYKDFTVCDLTTQMEDGRYMARAPVVGCPGSRTLSQRFLDFETFESEAEATARAQAEARAWIDEETLYVPLALPTNLSEAPHT